MPSRQTRPGPITRQPLGWGRCLQGRFRGGVAILDGSRLDLDAIAHRLKIAWHDRSVILPGCVRGVYDLFRSMLRGFQFDADAARSEFQRAMEGLKIGLPGWSLQADTLVVGDRLYCGPQIFEILRQSSPGFWAVWSERHDAVKQAPEDQAAQVVSYRYDGGRVEEWLVDAGRGATAPVQRLRYIRYQRKKKLVGELLTNLLDAKRLSGREALALYRKRWSGRSSGCSTT